jgi:hypothetical protein
LKTIEYRELRNEFGEVYKEQWPFLGDEKALSPSSILKLLYAACYGTGGNKVGFSQGKDFEEMAKTILEGGSFSEAFSYIAKWPNLKKRGLKFIKYLLAARKSYAKKPQHNTIGWTIFKGKLIGCETDFEFENAIWELKKSNELKPAKEIILDTIFELQCYIQHLCFNKIIYLMRVYEVKGEVKIVKKRFKPNLWHDEMLSQLLITKGDWEHTDPQEINDIVVQMIKDFRGIDINEV